MYSPYAPPAAPSYGPYPTPYRPLGGLTTMAIVALVATVPVHLATNALVIVTAPAPGTDAAAELAGSLPMAFALLGAALLTIGANLLACVLFLVWLHRAASNLRAFDRRGLEFTPGWCVGWWFIPFANLVKPFQAVKEVWRASDPDAVGGDEWAWRASPLASTMGVWWAAWVVSGVLDRIAGRLEDANVSGPLGLGAAFVSGAAALALIPIMRQLAARQDASWEKQRARENMPAPYNQYAA